MPTATLKLSHQNTQTYTRALIDSGSQRSFICAKLANKLKLPVVGTVNMNLSTFGTDPTPQVFHLVRAKMQIGSRRFTGKLIVHDNVNTEIVSPGIHKVTSMLANKGINLADRHVNGDKLRNVQLLIGVDYFNQIVISHSSHLVVLFRLDHSPRGFALQFHMMSLDCIATVYSVNPH